MHLVFQIWNLRSCSPGMRKHSYWSFRKLEWLLQSEYLSWMVGYRLVLKSTKPAPSAPVSSSLIYSISLNTQSFAILSPSLDSPRRDEINELLASSLGLILSELLKIIWNYFFWSWKITHFLKKLGRERVTIIFWYFLKLIFFLLLSHARISWNA